MKISFLDPVADVSAIQGLQRGHFALPAWRPCPTVPHLAAGPRLRRSVRGIQTILTNAGLSKVALLLDDPEAPDLPNRMAFLEADILQKMSTYLRHPGTGLIVEIFHSTQLWGGIAGRGIYVRGDGWEKNLDVDAYKGFAQWAISGGPLAARVQGMREAVGKIAFFGLSFASKHASLWARAAQASPLPIYDRLMAQGCMGEKHPSWGLYPDYVTKMEVHAQAAGVGVEVLERHAFNFFASTPGAEWLKERLK